jgi:hypothetical protein
LIQAAFKQIQPKSTPFNHFSPLLFEGGALRGGGGGARSCGRGREGSGKEVRKQRSEVRKNRNSWNSHTDGHGPQAGGKRFFLFAAFALKGFFLEPET